MSKLVFVDADGLLYIAGAIGEERQYSCEVRAEGDEDTNTMHFESVAAIKEWLLQNPTMEVVEKEVVVIPGPVEFCLQVAKQKMIEIRRKYGKNTEVYLKADGATNFRDKIATLHPYKGNRSLLKPYWLAEIKKYLINTWDAIEIDGKEADDQIATRAYEASRDYVVCTPDKDLDQIPGLHWNYSKSVEYMVNPIDARNFFWQQVLSGDAADNIKGCWKLGVSGAEKWVAENEHLHDEEIWEKVVEEYTNSMGLPNCPYAGMPAELVAIENARLVWMQTEARRLWTPPGYPKEYLEATLDD